MKLSYIAETLPGSQILAISNAIKQRIRSGEELYNYTIGDFDPAIFPIPSKLEQEIIKAYRSGYTNYPAAQGNADLREAIVSFTKIIQGIEFDESEILVGSGGRPLIYTLYQAVADPGDKVIYPVPSWNNHYYSQLTRSVPCEIQTTAENYFMPTAEQVAPHVKDAVLLALCSPQNPTGTCFTEAGLKAICELVLEENKRRGDDEKKLYILFDQIYGLLTYGDHKHFDPINVCPEIKPYVVYVDAVSKSFAATGVRVGWCMGPAAILSKMRAMLTHVGAWAPMAEQKAVTNFLSNPDAVKIFLQVFKKKLQSRLQQLYEGFISLKKEGYPVDAIPPQAAIYLTVKIDIPDADKQLLRAGIGVLPFHVFGADKNLPWCRISVGTCRAEDITPMFEKLKLLLCHTIIA